MLEQGLEGKFLDAGFEQNASRNLENGKEKQDVGN